MIWNICFPISLLILIAAVAYALAAVKRYKSDRVLTPFYALFAGVFLALFTGMIPVFSDMLAEEAGFGVKLFAFDMIQTIQVFTVNTGGDFVLDNISSAATPMSGAYSVYIAILFFVAPVLTFGFLVSLFRNLIEDLNYRLHYFEDVYAFSEFNEKSMLLAESIRENHGKAVIVFADVDREEGNVQSDLVEAALSIKAVILKKNIVTADLTRHSPNARIFLFAIGQSENENLIVSLKLLEKYKDKKNISLYTFSTSAEGELLLANADRGDVKLRRVNEVRSLIYRFLYDEGEQIFASALPDQEGRKMIHILIAGLGNFGTEILKAVTWYCQMDGYSVAVDVFDQDELAEEKFAALSPELMDPGYNGVLVPGETEYTIRIHSGVDVRTKNFADALAGLDAVSFVFVCLGEDGENINQAANIRMLCERCGHKPVIKTVVHNVEENQALRGITNYRGQAYGIEPMGDLTTAYSEEILIGSELEKLALERHLKWGQEEEFWQYEYNYRSSMATAVHRKARIACAIPGAEKKGADLTLAERDSLEALEHRRWNAYMRSEGYVYSGSPDKSSRNDLAKMHHDLVVFDALTEEEKRKDSSVATL